MSVLKPSKKTTIPSLSKSFRYWKKYSLLLSQLRQDGTLYHYELAEREKVLMENMVQSGHVIEISGPWTGERYYEVAR